MKRFFRNLKTLAMVAVVGFSTLAVSCYDDTELREGIKQNTEDLAALTARVEALEIKLGNEVNALKALIADEIAKVNDAIEAVEDKIVIADAEKNADGEWILTLANGETVTVFPKYQENHNGLLTVVKENGVYYWAQIVDGEPVKLTDANGNAYMFHHATVVPEIEIPEGHAAPEVRVNEAGFTEVSFDGGLTWHQMGGGDTGLFESVIATETSITFVLNGGQEFTVTLPEEVAFNVEGNKIFLNAGETVAVAIKATGVKDMLLLNQPEGWGVELQKNKVVVTAPAAEAEAPQVGGIKILAITNEGKVMLGKLTVSLEKGVYISIGMREVRTGFDENWDPVYETVEAIIFDNQMTELVEDSNTPGEFIEQERPLIVGIFPKGEFTPDQLASELAQGYMGSYPYSYENVYYNGETAFPLNGFFCDSWSGEVIPFEVGGAYTIFATPYTSAGMGATINPDDIVLYEYINSTFLVEEVSSSAFDVQIKVNIAGYPEGYRMYFADAQYSWEDEWNMCQQWGDDFGSFMNVEKFEGSLFDFTFIDNGWSDKEIGLPCKQYQLVLIPIHDGQYVKEDAKIYYFSTKDIEAGGTVNPTFTEGDSGYDTIKVDVSAPGAKLTYYNFMNEDAYGQFLSDDEIREYLIDNGAVKVSESFTASTSGLKQGAVRYLVAMSVDKDGKYGAITKQAFSSKVFQFSETATIAIEDFKLSTLGNELKVKVSVSGTDSAVKEYRYANVNSEFSWTNTYGGSYESAAAYIATVPNAYYGPKFVQPSELDEEGYFTVPNLSVGVNYNFVVLAMLENGEVTPGVGKNYDTEMAVTLVYADEAGYDEYKPTVTIDSVEDGSYDWSEDDKKITYTITPVAGTKVYNKLMDNEYELTYNTPFTLMQYLATDTGTSYYYSQVCTEQTTYVFESYAYATSYLYVTWSNPEGDKYYQTMKVEIPGVTGVETEVPEEGGEGGEPGIML